MVEATLSIAARVGRNGHQSGKALDKDSMATYNIER